MPTDLAETMGNVRMSIVLTSAPAMPNGPGGTVKSMSMNARFRLRVNMGGPVSITMGVTPVVAPLDGQGDTAKTISMNV